MFQPSRTLSAASVVFLVLVSVLFGSTSVSAQTVGYNATVVNADANGNQVTRYDTLGNAVDAHDGEIKLFNGIYHLYGTSYDCGYTLNTRGTKFCGFKVYTSTDLRHWTDQGYLFDPTSSTWQNRCSPDGPSQFGCYRPHVVYNAANRNYVLWINGYDNLSGYHAFTSASPTGPFVEVAAAPTLALQSAVLSPGTTWSNGDFGLFVDTDGTGYIAYTNISGGGHDQVVERLNATYTSGTGAYASVLKGASTEGPSMFKRNGIYYYLQGATCPYCSNGSAPEYETAINPLGPWSAKKQINTSNSSNSCSGQTAFVSQLGSTYLYGADQWNGNLNEALANYYWQPLSFSAAGEIQPFVCANTVTVPLDSGSGDSQVSIAGTDQSDGVDGFRTWCDIGGEGRRLQSFTAGRSGTLSSVSITTFKNGGTPTGTNADLTAQIYRVDSSFNPTGAALYSTSVPSSAIGWSPRNLNIAPGINVTAGTRYGIVLSSPSLSSGCYGFTYNDSAPYPGGGEAYSFDNGNTWHGEVNVSAPSRSMKFSTTINGATGPTGYSYCAPEDSRCSFYGTHDVAYGANGSFTYGTYTGGTPCSNAVHGDPIFGTVKACYLR